MEYNWYNVIDTSRCTAKPLSCIYAYILPLPCNQSSVCSLWVCFANKFICIISFQVLHISNIVLGYSSFCGFTQYDLLFMHVAANDIIPNGCVIFHYINKYTHTHTHTHHVFFIHSSVGWYLGCFPALAIVNSTPVNFGCMYPFRSCFSLDICPGMGLQDMVAVFKGNSILFSGEGNGTPLQYSCLENPMDGGVW